MVSSDIDSWDSNTERFENIAKGIAGSSLSKSLSKISVTFTNWSIGNEKAQDIMNNVDLEFISVDEDSFGR